MTEPRTETRQDTKQDTKRAWDEVGADCTDLGGKLRRHFAQVRDTDGAEAADALRKLATAVGDAFEAVGVAARDPEVRNEARKVAGSLTAALGATFAGVGDEARKVFAKARGAETPPPAGSAAAGSAWAPPSGPVAAHTPSGGPTAGSHATAAPPEDQLPD